MLTFFAVIFTLFVDIAMLISMAPTLIVASWMITLLSPALLPLCDFLINAVRENFGEMDRDSDSDSESEIDS